MTLPPIRGRSIAILYQRIAATLRRRALARRVHRARLRGKGLHERSWEVASPGISTEILAWCRHVLGASRRPHGVALFDLSLSFRAPGCRSRSLSFSRLEPASLWDDGGLAATLEVVLAAAPVAATVSVGIFCWGDALHAALVS